MKALATESDTKDDRRAAKTVISILLEPRLNCIYLDNIESAFLSSRARIPDFMLVVI